jgi:hypothetical protein
MEGAKSICTLYTLDAAAVPEAPEVTEESVKLEGVGEACAAGITGVGSGLSSGLDFSSAGAVAAGGSSTRAAGGSLRIMECFIWERWVAAASVGEPAVAPATPPTTRLAARLTAPWLGPSFVVSGIV